MLTKSRWAAPVLSTALFVASTFVAGAALADDVPSEPPKKDTGCGCETSGSPHAYGALSLAFMGVGLVLFRRSLRSSKRSD